MERRRIQSVQTLSNLSLILKNVILKYPVKRLARIIEQSQFLNRSTRSILSQRKKEKNEIFSILLPSFLPRESNNSNSTHE